MPIKKREEEREEELVGSFVYLDGSTYEGRFQAKSEGGAAGPGYPTASHKRGPNAVNHSSAPKSAGSASSQFGGAVGASAGPVDPNTQPVVQHGAGRFVDRSGAVYDGQWVDGKISGSGTYTYGSGASYTGSIVEHRYHGTGKYMWPDGSYYEGQWKNNLMHGLGTYVDPHGKRWYGKFYNGKGVDVQPELIF